MFLDVDVSELKTIHAAAKKLIGKNTGVPNSILLESSANKLTAKIITGGNWLCYEAKLLGNSKGDGAFLIPLDKLESLANAPAKSKISFTGDGSSQVNVVVDSGSFSRQYKLDCPPLDDFQDITPPELAEIDSGSFLSHLDKAIDCTAATPSRYALNMVQLDGDNGRVIGCDGHRLFIGNSLAFPFKGKLHLHPDALLRSKSIRKEGPVSVGVADDRIFLRLGPWTIGQQFIEGRYPNVDEVIPKDADLRTSITFTDEQAKVLLDALDILPGKEGNRTVKLTVTNRLYLSAMDDESGAESGMDLSAAVAGEAKTTCFNRNYLAHAVESGFRQFQISHTNGAVFATNATAKYLFMCIRTEEDSSRAGAGSAQATGDANHAATASHASASASSQVQTGNVSSETTASNRKEQTMENQGTTAVINTPANQTTGTATQTGQTTQASDKPAPVSGFHTPPVSLSQTPTNAEITPETLNQHISAAKDAIRAANNALSDLQQLVKDYTRQSKEREKANSAALRTLENIKRMAA